MLDYSGLFRADLPPAAGRWNGFPKYNFVGGHNDAASVPVADLIAAATRVLAREGRTLATYGLNSGPLGYRPLREFIVRKLARVIGLDEIRGLGERLGDFALLQRGNRLSVMPVTATQWKQILGLEKKRA